MTNVDVKRREVNLIAEYGTLHDGGSYSGLIPFPGTKTLTVIHRKVNGWKIKVNTNIEQWTRKSFVECVTDAEDRESCVNGEGEEGGCGYQCAPTADRIWD